MVAAPKTARTTHRILAGPLCTKGAGKDLSLLLGASGLLPDIFPSSDRADTSFRCRNEVPECHRFRRPSPFSGFFEHLLRAEAAPIQQFERALHFGAQGCP